MKHVFRLALLSAALLAGSPMASAQDGLTESQRFISYPFMTRAWQVATRNDWQEVESITRFLLQRVPTNQEARALLVDSLAHQARYADALEEVASMTDATQRERVVFEVRMQWIAQEDPGAGTVAGWLQDSSPESRSRLWQGYSMAVQQRDGPDAARAWLSQVRGADGPELAQWQAVLDELRGDPRGVVTALAPELAAGRIQPDDWRRLGLAYARLENWGGLEKVLAAAPNEGAAAELRRVAADKAVASGRAELALRWLGPLEDSGSEADRKALWELGRLSGKAELVERLSDTLGRPCLETVEWLMLHDMPRAARRLPACDAQQDPRRWMVLAERLRMVEHMAEQRFTGEWQALQQERVVALWRQSGETPRALRWLDTQPAGPLVAKLRAELLQGTNDPRAADAWLAYYRQSGRMDALDQATFQLMDQGRDAEALASLERAYTRNPSRFPPALLERMVALVVGSGRELDDDFLDAVLPRMARRDRAQLLVGLADAGRCDRLARWIPQHGRLAVESVALARCADPRRPGVAVVHYRAALEAGADTEQRALAYALQAAGDDAGAYAIWRDQSPESLSRDDRMAAARSALGTGHADVADEYWQSLDAETRETSADALRLGAAIALAADQPELALERDRRVLELDPSAGRYYDAAGTALAADEPDISLEWLGRSVELAPDNRRYRLDYALRLAAHEERDTRLTAIPQLEQARRDYPADIRVPEALSLRYMENDQDTLASPAMREAIDLQNDELMVATESPEWLAKRRYAMRRSHEAQERRDSFTLASTWSPYSVAGTAGQPIEGQNYQIAMWDHVLEDDDGNARNHAIYGRVLGAGPTRNDYFDAMGVGVGLRVKPWREQNINLYAELYYERDLEGNGGRKGDVLLRATASFLDQGEYRNDWRPTESIWNERSLYLDAAWFLREDERLFLARYQQGRTFKLPLRGAHTLMPYAMVQGMQQDVLKSSRREDLRVGFGLRWQTWFDHDRYSAYRGRLSVRAEYQKGLAGSLYGRQGGWLLGVELNW